MGDRTKRLQRASLRAGMTPLSDILPDIMAGIIERACAAGHPPPAFVTGGYDHSDDAPTPKMSAPPIR